METTSNKSLLQKVLIQKKVDVVNLWHLHNACISIQQDCADQLKDIFAPQKYFRKVTNEYIKCLEIEITEMQKIANDEQLLTLQNNECMELIFKKIIESTKNGTIEALGNLILNF